MDAKAQAVYAAIWTEGLDDLPYRVLEAAFRKTLRECLYWPIKVANIREHVDRTKKAALPEEAVLAWEKVLAIRREHFNPDFPQYLTRAVAMLPERVQRAARASGIFQEVSDPDQIHVWGKKRFIESYVNWNEIEENEFPLPDGEIKNLMIEFAKTKALPE